MHNRPSPTFQLPPLTPWVRGLMIALGTIFLLEVLIRVILGFDTPRFHALVLEPIALSGSGVLSEARIWQPFTYFWISPIRSLWPIVFSLFSIYFFGPPVELELGGRRMLISFISAGVAGAIAALAVAALFLRHHPLYDHILLGPQAATSGLVAMLCWWWKDRRLNLIIVQPTGWQLLVGFAALIVLQGLISQPYLIVPDLGGLLMGMAAGSGKGPYGLYQRIRLRYLRRKLRHLRGGKDVRDWMH